MRIGLKNRGITIGTGEQIGEQVAKHHYKFLCKSVTCSIHSVDASPSTRARIISGPFFLPEIPAPRGVPAIGAAGGCQPKRWKSAIFSARAVSVLRLACG